MSVFNRVFSGANCRMGVLLSGIFLGSVSGIALSHAQSTIPSAEDISRNIAPGETTEIRDGDNGFREVVFFDSNGNQVSVVESGTPNLSGDNTSPPSNPPSAPQNPQPTTPTQPTPPNTPSSSLDSSSSSQQSLIEGQSTDYTIQDLNRNDVDSLTRNLPEPPVWNTGIYNNRTFTGNAAPRQEAALKQLIEAARKLHEIHGRVPRIIGNDDLDDLTVAKNNADIIKLIEDRGAEWLVKIAGVLGRAIATTKSELDEIKNDATEGGIGIVDLEIISDDFIKGLAGDILDVYGTLVREIPKYNEAAQFTRPQRRLGYFPDQQNANALDNVFKRNVKDRANSFSWSLSKWRQNKPATRTFAKRVDINRGTIGIDDTLRRQLSFLANPRFNLWFNGSFAQSDDRRPGNEADGRTFQFNTGLSYRVTEFVNIGGNFRFSDNTSDRDDLTFATESKAFGGSIFAQILLPGQAVFTPIVAFERSNADIRTIVGGANLTGAFTNDVFTLGATLSRQFSHSDFEKNRRYFVTPKASLTLNFADRSAYRLSDGILINGERVQRGVFQFGPTFGIEFKDVSKSIATITPTLGLSGVWTFNRPNDFLSTAGTLIETPRFSASVNAGLGVRYRNGARTTIRAAYSGISSKVRTASIFGELSIPFGVK